MVDGVWGVVGWWWGVVCSVCFRVGVCFGAATPSNRSLSTASPMYDLSHHSVAAGTEKFQSAKKK